MKEVFINNGIPCAKGELVKNLNHALSIIEKIGFPAILKPDYGVGASGIFVINNHQDLHNIIPSLQSDYLLEEFVSAPMLTFDGLAGANGEILFANSLEYSEGILEYVHGKDPSFFINKQIDPVLMQLGERLVKAFNIKKRFFHFEFFKMEDEVKYWPVEINCRPPGGPIIDMMNYSVDQDLYQSYARLIAGEDVHLANEKKYYCGYVGRRFGKHYFNEHDLVMKRYDSYFVECVENPHVFRQAMGDFRYIFRTDDEVILKKIMAELLTH
ncbi:MAG: ATP-grasp domain-containing protein [Bacteriovoracia bacterium]